MAGVEALCSCSCPADQFDYTASDSQWHGDKRAFALADGALWCRINICIMNA